MPDTALAAELAKREFTVEQDGGSKQRFLNVANPDTPHFTALGRLGLNPLRQGPLAQRDGTNPCPSWEMGTNSRWRLSCNY